MAVMILFHLMVNNMLNELVLLSGNDIPFAEAQIAIHQPSLKEIGYIGEDTFYTACEFLRFSKDNLNEEDRIHLEEQSNFEILMSIMKEQNIVIQRNKACVLMLLTLLFPEYQINIKDTYISLIKQGEKDEHQINNKNFEMFKSILEEMFVLKQTSDDYNPQGELARKIANKLKKRKQKLAEEKNKTGRTSKITVLSRYTSILAVGEHKNLNELMQYTVYQLFDEFRRFELKMAYDANFSARLAGAKDLKEAEDWMKDLYSEESDFDI